MIIPVLPDEHWYGGCVDDGWRMPFTEGFARDLASQGGNQVQPLLLSDQGRWLWCEEPFTVTLADGKLAIASGGARVLSGRAEGGLRGAALAAAARFFPPSGSMPAPLLFTRPQYNTWIELMYDQAEAPILAYAERLIAEGYPPGVLMIDDTWQDGYGVWEWNPGRFRDPRALVRRLHDLGFQVMLWVCPFVSADTAEYRECRDRGLLLVDRVEGNPVIRPWWNGYSAVLDLTNPDAAAWMQGRLDRLVAEHGVDGFKFDAGDFSAYRAEDRAVRPGHPATHSEAWARFGMRWPLNEYRACWKLGNQPLAQRLKDKLHTWDELGLGSCIPNALAQGLVGYPFCCPDMIGGGEYYHFRTQADRLDPELFVRYAQASALMPMMQFSAAPWRVLPREHAALCLAAARLHAAHGERILALARYAAATGEPIMRHLAWAHGPAHAAVRDQFLLGDELLVAPVVQPGQRRRTVVFPAGRWLGDDGTLIEGPTEREVDAPLGRLPHYLRQ